MWLAKRVGVSLILIWFIVSFVVLAIRLVPGDPAEVLLSQGGVAPDPSVVAELREQLGLNKPVLQQYVETVQAWTRGDLGRSLQDGTPVASEVFRRLPRTLELIFAAALIAVVVALPAGTYTALRPAGAFDRASSAVAALAVSVPVFVIGTGLVLLFAQTLRWLPAGGFVPFARSPVQHVLLLLMPAMTIAAGLSAMLFRMTRASVSEVMNNDYVRAARARGVAPGRVVRRHILRNALMPVVTVLALQMGNLLGGTVLVEYVFNWPGLSALLVSSVSSRDYPVVVGTIAVITVLFVLLNLLVDIIYGVIDPRVRRR